VASKRCTDGSELRGSQSKEGRHLGKVGDGFGTTPKSSRLTTSRRSTEVAALAQQLLPFGVNTQPLEINPCLPSFCRRRVRWQRARAVLSRSRSPRHPFGYKREKPSFAPDSYLCLRRTGHHGLKGSGANSLSLLVPRRFPLSAIMSAPWPEPTNPGTPSHQCCLGINAIITPGADEKNGLETSDQNWVGALEPVQNPPLLSEVVRVKPTAA